MHEYIVRETGEIARERLVGDQTVRALYSPKLENAAWVSKLASSRKVSELLGYLNYDNRLSSRASGMKRFSEEERHRLVRTGGRAVVVEHRAPDVRAQDSLLGVSASAQRESLAWSVRRTRGLRWAQCRRPRQLLIKEKFFAFPELLGGPRSRWTKEFKEGDLRGLPAYSRKIPLHACAGAGGTVADFYAVNGRYHSCNPNATVKLITPHSKNKRVVTIIDTDCAGGTGIGLVAMIEVVALMIGQIDQRYSEHEYRDPDAD